MGSARAQKKWDELDADNSDVLDGDEVMELAEWVWKSFRPGKEITPAQRMQEATKLMGRCDKNGDGTIDREEFSVYYDEIVAQMTKFHEAKAAKDKKATEKAS